MAFAEPLDVFFGEFGVTCTAGSTSGKGLLDMPADIIADGAVVTTDYALTAKWSDFGTLTYGDGMVVDGIGYQVREVMRLDDGKFVQIGLQRLPFDETVPGVTPRNYNIGDLQDVTIRNPESGDFLTYDGDKWVDSEGDDGTNVIGGGGA
tara:strand:- start:630 stop:1079 length:450 start_codon:yes stop_codon:yes gene_type:complete